MPEINKKDLDALFNKVATGKPGAVAQLIEMKKTPEPTEDERFHNYEKDKDPWKLLAVPKLASQKEIKKERTILLGKYHTDKNKAADAADKFAMIEEAYAAICKERGW